MKQPHSHQRRHYSEERHPPPADPEADDLDFLGGSTLPTFSSSNSRSKPIPTSISTLKGTKRKTAQSIQTPSASPRHQPIPVASTSTHHFAREDRRSEEDKRRIRKEQHEVVRQQDLKRAQRVHESAREEHKRKRLSNSSRTNPEPTQSSPRQERSNRRSLGKEKAMEEEMPEPSTRRRKRRTSEKEERVPYDDGRIFRNGQLVRPSRTSIERRSRDQSEEEVEAEEEVVKREESLEDSDCMIVKEEEEEEEEEDTSRRSSTENEEDNEEREVESSEPAMTEPELFALKQLGKERQRLLRYQPLVLPVRSPVLAQARPLPNQQPTFSRPQPQPQPEPLPDSPPSLASFLESLDLPRLSRLIPHFHEIGVESPEEVFALSSQTAVGKKRRENVMAMIEEMERGRGREFKRFERDTIDAELEEARKGWARD
ncbi:hypothetical protein JCM5353_006852 [Sporobolomyces roseus]